MSGLVAARWFVGRADELRRLEEGLASALTGRAAAFLLVGDAGAHRTPAPPALGGITPGATSPDDGDRGSR